MPTAHDDKGDITMRVLVADDSKAVRMIVIRTLRQSGMAIDEIHEAEDGAAALALVPDSKPDLILSDGNMPKTTGNEFLAALREQGDSTTSGFVTSESNPDMEDQAFATGAHSLLTKPFSGDRFAGAIAPMVR